WVAILARLRVLHRERELDDERRPEPASLALGAYGTAVQADQLAHDRQAETEPTVAARARAVRLPEAGAHPRHELPRDALPRAGPAERGAGRPGVEVEIDPAVGGCVLDRVLEQVDDDLLESPRISEDALRRRRRRRRQGDALRRRGGLDPVDRRRDHHRE